MIICCVAVDLGNYPVDSLVLLVHVNLHKILHVEESEDCK